MPRMFYFTNRNQDQPPPFPAYGADVTAVMKWGIGDAPDFPGGKEDNVDPSALQIQEICQGAATDAFIGAVNAVPGNHLLIFFHGFNFKFWEAVRHAAWLKTWFALADSRVLGAAGAAAVDGPILCFSFPSLGAMIEDNQTSLEKMLNGAYETDHANAGASGPTVAASLADIQRLVTAFRNSRGGAGRVTVLAHSMGNHVLACALGDPAAVPPPAPIFDRIISIAGDETQTCVASGIAPGAPNLRNAEQWAQAVYLYYNEWDIPLWYSGKLFDGDRLGKYGPPLTAGGFDLPQKFRIIDCSTASPSPSDHGSVDDPDWEHHQYYRLYEWVRDDLALVMAGIGGVGSFATPADLQGDIDRFPLRRLNGQNSELINLFDPYTFQTVVSHHSVGRTWV